jgi:hypothetical protein
LPVASTVRVGGEAADEGSPVRIEVRVPRDDFDRLSANFALNAHLRVISFEVPAAGPEMGLIFEGVEMGTLQTLLRAHGFTVLGVADRTTEGAAWRNL